MYACRVVCRAVDPALCKVCLGSVWEVGVGSLCCMSGIKLRTCKQLLTDVHAAMQCLIGDIW